MSHCVRPTTDTHRSVAVAQGRPHTMPNPLAFVGGGAALTAAARAADKANGGGGPFRRLGEGRGAALREAWPVEALHTVPAARRAAAGDADELFAYARPPSPCGCVSRARAGATKQHCMLEGAGRLRLFIFIQSVEQRGAVPWFVHTHARF